MSHFPLPPNRCQPPGHRCPLGIALWRMAQNALLRADRLNWHPTYWRRYQYWLTEYWRHRVACTGKGEPPNGR